MGVPGLTTYISTNSDKYLTSHQLRDTYLVIDGDNIASNLYKWHTRSNDCFGGDYDAYTNTITRFFHILSECSITPIVVFDGAYEDKKLGTVYSRMRDRIKSGGNVKSATRGYSGMFPLLTRELFADVVLQMGLNVVKCQFEADIETAALARTLGCPVLSYDSDYFILDVIYVPFDSFGMKVEKDGEKRKFISCKVYTMESFMKMFGKFERKELPLLGVVLGNDYIKRSVFAKFYSNLSLPKGKHFKNEQQKSIAAVIAWLRSESYQSALEKILRTLKLAKRKLIAKHINKLMEGYNGADSNIIKLLNIKDLKIQNLITDFSLINLDTLDQIQTDVESEDDDCSEKSETEETREFPDWFLKNFNLCKYPSCFMDMITKNVCYCTPQFEDYSNICSHLICLDVIATLHRILTSGKSKQLKLIHRENYHIKKSEIIWENNMNTPNLNEIRRLTPKAAEKFILEVLKIDELFLESLSILPKNWHLFMIIVKFWCENSKPQVTLQHVYSLILCAIILSFCDQKIGIHRSPKKFANKFGTKVRNLLNNPRKNDLNKLYVKNIDFRDSLLCLNELVIFFQMDSRMKSTSRYFDIGIVDSFAQFQSCFLHIKYLNALLNEPFEKPIISNFYNGTFIYNMTATLLLQTSGEKYLENCLKNSPSVLGSLKKIMKILKGTVTLAENIKKGRRRRRKKKNAENSNTVNEETQNLSITENDESDGSLLKDNPYSLLLQNKEF